MFALLEEAGFRRVKSVVVPGFLDARAMERICCCPPDMVPAC